MRKFILPLAAISVAVAAVSCREWEPPVFDAHTELPNVALGDLRTYLGGEGELTFAEDIVVAGRVVTTTAAGNFYNTFFIDDGTGGAEIMAGMYDLDAAFREGQRVSVRLRGLAVGWRDGAMQIGLPPEPGSPYATGYFYHRAVMRPWVAAERDVVTVEPLDLSYYDLHGMLASYPLYGQTLCGRLVRISGLVADARAARATGATAAATATVTWATAEPVPTTGYVDFYPAADADTNADTNARADTNPDTQPITVVTSGYASFAADAVPGGEVALTGILFYGRADGSSDRFMLKLRDENDITPM